jgi:phasin family protein
MARKASANAKNDTGARKRAARTRTKPAPTMNADDASNPARGRASTRKSPMPEFADTAQMATMMTPDQAIDLYKANAALALEVINAAIEGAERVRNKQVEAAEEAREFQRRHARSAAQARDPKALAAAGQDAAQEALERSMRYWGEMFDLIVEIQKRVFTLIDRQMDGVPGVREARAAMALLPDMSAMQKVASALQGAVSSGETTFASMQRVMGDFSKLAQGSTAR